MKAESKPSGSTKRKPEVQAGIQQQKRQKLQKTAKGSSPACVLPVSAPLPAVKKEEAAPAVKKEEPATAVEKEEPDGLGLTWESF